MFLTEIGVDLIEGALGGRRGGGFLEPCNAPLGALRYTKKNPTELRSYHGVVFVNTLLSINKGTDCVLGLFSAEFEKRFCYL